MAAVVPSRARAHARPPPEASHVLRMTLSIQRITGDVSPPPCLYFFRWIRAGKPAKVTAAKSLDSAGNFGDRMALYARIRPRDGAITSSDPAEPLDTTLVLLTAADVPSTPPTVVSELPFDMAAYILKIALSATKSISTTVTMPPSIALTLTISVKEIGEKFLHLYANLLPNLPHTPPQLSTSANTSSSDMDEAAAALALERIRQQVRDKQQRLDSLEKSADSLHQSLREADALSADVSALQQRVRTLEEQYAQCEREKLDAERRVAAHVTHAAKIKSTYNQLAEWYNTLRQEHAELQAKLSHPPSQTDSAAVTEESSVASSQETDMLHLQKERDQLRQSLQNERDEKDQINSRNSQLLESKARALAELRGQWDAAKNDYEQTRKRSQQNAKALADLQQTVDSLSEQLKEKETQLQEKLGALSQAETLLREKETQHEAALIAARSEASESEKSSLDAQLEDLKKLHAMQLESAVKQKEQAFDQVLEEKVQAMRTEHESNIAAERTKVTEQLESKRKDELDALVAEYEHKQKTEREALSERIRELEQTLETSKTVASNSEQRTTVLESELKSLKEEYDELKATAEARSAADTETHQRQLEDVVLEKQKLSLEIEQLRQASALEVKNLTTQVEQSSRRAANMEAQCDEMRAQLETLEKEYEEARSSPREVYTHPANETEQIAANLNKQIGELEGLLRTETQKRNEVSRLLENADREHDELREMVTRLRKERDEALSDLKRMRDVVPNPEVRNPVIQRTLSRGSNDGQKNAIEERDSAIRELFRVRKGLNKQIRQLKQEKLELTRQLANGPSEDEATALKTQLAKIELQQKTHVEELEVSKSQVAEARNLLSAERQAAAQEIARTKEMRALLSAKEEELAALKSKAAGLEVSLTANEEESMMKLKQLEKEKVEFQRQLESTRTELSTLETDLRSKTEIISRLESELKTTKMSLAELSSLRDTVSRERDSARHRSSALETELESLKESLSAVSNSTSSTESLLRDAQKEVAERKAESNLLHAEMEDLKKAASEQVLKHQSEIASVQQEIAESQLLLKERDKQLHDLQRQIGEQLAHLETERSSRESESKAKCALEDLVQRLKSRNTSLTESLATESSARQLAETRLVDTDDTLKALRLQVSELDSKNSERLRAEQKISMEMSSLHDRLKETTTHLAELDRQLSDKRKELDSANHKLQASEGIREKLAQEVADSKAKAEAYQSNMDGLKRALHDANVKLSESEEKRHSIEAREASVARELSDLADDLKNENTSLQAKLETAEREVSHLEKMNSSLLSPTDAAELMASRDQAIAECHALTRAKEALQHSLNEAQEESESAKSEIGMVSQQMKSVTQDLDELKGELGFVQEERDTVVAQLRASEDEVKRLSEVHKELKSARSLIESQQRELEKLKTENAKLTREASSGADAEVLTDLINTRLELAYVQEEVVRLRNKLTKMSPGSRSFEG